MEEIKSKRMFAHALLGYYPPFAMPASSGRTPTTPTRDGGTVDQAGRGLFGLEGRAGRRSKEEGVTTKPAEEVGTARDNPGLPSLLGLDSKPQKNNMF